MKKEYIGIDLGSNNTTIYSSFAHSVVYSEPTCIVIEKETQKVRETGLLASRAAGKSPANMKVIYPIQNGIIIDDDAVFEFLDKVFKTLNFSKNQLSRLVFTCPSNCSKVNRKAILELGRKLGAKEVIIESQAKIAALGVGLNVFSPTATMVVQIGAGISDVACLSLGELVSCDSTFIAGNTFDEAIRRYMIQKQHLSIGLKSAEYIKMRVGNLGNLAENRLAEIKGRDTITSLPASVVVSSGEIKNCLIPLANFIGLKITDVISTLPPELAADLTKNGIILTGGGSLLSGMKEYLQSILMVPVRIVEKPAEMVSEGFAVYHKVLNN